tara:strand:+ start:93 stop:263 length:171 start_codon:yes stop_codon:yes gene_type:complete
MGRYKEVADKIEKGEPLSDKEKKLHERRKLINKVNPLGFKLAKPKKKKESLKIKDD